MALLIEGRAGKKPRVFKKKFLGFRFLVFFYFLRFFMF